MTFTVTIQYHLSEEEVLEDFSNRLADIKNQPEWVRQVFTESYDLEDWLYRMIDANGLVADQTSTMITLSEPQKQSLQELWEQANDSD